MNDSNRRSRTKTMRKAQMVKRIRTRAAYRPAVGAGQHTAAMAVRTHYGFGATMQEDGDVRFCVWAPGQSQVLLDLPDLEVHKMNRNENGTHEIVIACEPGTRYRYRFLDGRTMPDPASRHQDGDVNGLSMVIDPFSYQWEHTEWRGRPWEETVIYEIHTGLAGGFDGVRAKLPELADLGITAIELMPIAEFSGERNWGYDGVLPYAPDESYGSPEQLRQLIDAAHGLGLQVFLDVVYNHFGPEGNFLFDCVPEFFRDDVQTPWGYAIDFRQPEVRAFFTENAIYWLTEYRFDGLRLDAVHAVSEPDWLPEMAHAVREAVGSDRHIHLVIENDNNDVTLLQEGFDAQWNDDAHHVVQHLLTGESDGYYGAYTDDTTQKLVRALAEGFVYQGEPCITRDGRPRGQPSGGLPPTSFIFFLQNHDQTGNRAFGERLTTLCEQRPEALRAAVALQLLAPHIPLIFMGEERGARRPFLYFTDFSDPDLVRAVREGRRREFRSFRTYSTENSERPLPDPNDESTWLASDPFAEPVREQTHELYRELLKVRRQFIGPFLEGARTHDVRAVGQGAVVARWRLGNGGLLTLYCNLSDVDHELGDALHDGGERCIYATQELADAALHAGTLLGMTTIATIVVPEELRQEENLGKDAPWQ